MSASCARQATRFPATRVFESSGKSSPIRMGSAQYAKLLARHNEMFEGGVEQYPSAEIIKHTGDGYFATFATASDAVRFALDFQTRMHLEAWQPCALTTRVGIHVGEVAV